MSIGRGAKQPSRCHTSILPIVPGNSVQWQSFFSLRATNSKVVGQPDDDNAARSGYSAARKMVSLPPPELPTAAMRWASILGSLFAQSSHAMASNAINPSTVVPQAKGTTGWACPMGPRSPWPMLSNTSTNMPHRARCRAMA